MVIVLRKMGEREQEEMVGECGKEEEWERKDMVATYVGGKLESMVRV